MILVFIILGIIFGVWIAELEGFFIGAVSGYLLGEVIRLKSRVKSLQLSVDNLSQATSPVTEPTPQTAKPEPVKRFEPAPSKTHTVTQPDKQAPQPAREAASKISGQSIAPEPATQSPSFSTPGPQPNVIDNWTQPSGYNPQDNIVWKWIKNYFTTGNTVVRVGIIILFFGVAFLAKYASERGVLPVEARIIGIALGGLVMLVIGWRLRRKNSAYALAIQGGGIGIVYLTIFAALRLFKDQMLLPPGLAFGLLLCVCILSATLAVVQNSRALAILGSSGGFLAPVLTSTGGGSHVMLFTYYALLNGGILAIAWHKAWRPLNLVGFVFTFVIGSAWGIKNYRDELFASTEPFLILFFLFYVAISVLYALRQPVNLRGYIDGTLVFGTPIIAFTLQFLLVRHIEYALAYSAIALLIFYVLLAYGIFKYVANYDKKDGIKLICQAFLAIGIVFGTVAIPLAVDDQWTSAAWALEGCALIWVAIRQKRLLPFAAGIFLQVGAAFFVAKFMQHVYHDLHMPIVNGAYLSAMLVGFAGLLSAFFIYKNKHDYKYAAGKMDWIAFVWGMFWWLFAGLYEINHHSANMYTPFWMLVFFSTSLIACHYIGKINAWRQMTLMHRVMIVFLLVSLIACASHLRHPFANFTAMAWLYSIAAYYWLLKQNDNEPLNAVYSLLHGAGMWLITLLLSWDAYWWIKQYLLNNTAWPLVAWLVVPATMLLFCSRADKMIAWPFNTHKNRYLEYVCTPVALYLVLTILITALASNGKATPLPYYPILNPLDLAQAFAFICITGWILILGKLDLEPSLRIDRYVIYACMAALLFIMVNSALIRTIHHWYQVPLTFNSIMHSDIAQTSLSLFWTIIAMVTMITASRKKARIIWIVGAALIGLVVIKLFTVDLANVGTIQRIISFIGVGILMLIIGYFTPLPPRNKAGANA